jgi:hypothetical protein
VSLSDELRPSRRPLAVSVSRNQPPVRHITPLYPRRVQRVNWKANSRPVKRQMASTTTSTRSTRSRSRRGARATGRRSLRPTARRPLRQIGLPANLARRRGCRSRRRGPLRQREGVHKFVLQDMEGFNVEGVTIAHSITTLLIRPYRLTTICCKIQRKIHQTDIHILYQTSNTITPTKAMQYM